MVGFIILTEDERGTVHKRQACRREGRQWGYYIHKLIKDRIEPVLYSIMDCVWVGKKYKKSYTVHRFYHIRGTESWIIRQGKIQYSTYTDIVQQMVKTRLGLQVYCILRQRVLQQKEHWTFLCRTTGHLVSEESWDRMSRVEYISQFKVELETALGYEPGD